MPFVGRVRMNSLHIRHVTFFLRDSAAVEPTGTGARMELHGSDGRGCGRRTACWLWLLLAAATPAAAQQVVHDPISLVEQLRQVASDAAEFGKTAERWSETAAHYQQQLVRMRRLNFGQAQMRDDFPPRPADYGMQDRCPGEDGPREPVAGLLKLVLPRLDGDLAREQLSLCQRRVYAENMKYNESVQMLRKLAVRNQEFQSLESQRDQVGTSQGALAANDNEARRFMLRTSMELDYWQARMRAYDDYIAALKVDQSRLAKRALDGNKGTPIGNVIQAGVLAAALRH